MILESETDDAQLIHEGSGRRDKAPRRAFHLDASSHRPDVSLPAGLPYFVQEDVAVAPMGRRNRHTALARVDRRRRVCSQSMRLLNV